MIKRHYNKNGKSTKVLIKSQDKINKIMNDEINERNERKKWVRWYEYLLMVDEETWT